MNPIDACNFEYRPKLARQSTESSWTYRQSSTDLSTSISPPTTTSSSDISTISGPSSSSGPSTSNEQQHCDKARNRSRSRALDVRPLTFHDRLRLFRIHYVFTFNNNLLNDTNYNYFLL